MRGETAGADRLVEELVAEVGGAEESGVLTTLVEDYEKGKLMFSGWTAQFVRLKLRRRLALLEVP